MNLGPHDIAGLANYLKSVRPTEAEEIENILELKGCGANKPGGGGFSAGNTCARGGGGSKDLKVGDSVTPKILKESGYKYYRQSGMNIAVYRNESSGKQLSVDVNEKGVPTKVRSISDFRGQKRTPKGKHTGFFEQGYD